LKVIVERVECGHDVVKYIAEQIGIGIGVIDAWPIAS
jgi:hypothetical protein